MQNNFILKTLILTDGEILIKIVRQATTLLGVKLFLPTLIFILDFFFLYPLFNLGNKGITVFLGLIIISVFLAAKIIFIWYSKVLIITNQRIIDIDRKGIFRKTVSEVSLDDINEVLFQAKGVFQTLFRLGKLEIIIKENKIKIEINNINRPHRIQQLLLQLKSAVPKKWVDFSKMSDTELLNLVKKIQDYLANRGQDTTLDKNRLSQVED
jgi:hypothetical protein